MGVAPCTLVAEHKEPVSQVQSDLHLVSVMCGVGAIALACEATGEPPVGSSGQHAGRRPGKNTEGGQESAMVLS